MTARNFANTPTVAGLPLSGFVYPEDTFTESTAITSYREGASTMGVSAAADWDDQAADSVVRTIRSGSVGRQELSFDYGANYIRFRTWVNWASVWEAWSNHVTDVDISTYYVSISQVTKPQDAVAESGDLSLYTNYRNSLMSVTGAANWGPNTNEAGHVTTERMDSNGKQTFHQYSNGTSYERTYTSSAWGSWRSTKDADTLDGNDSAYFATATSVSDHLGDATDAHDATAISYAGSTNLASTTVEAAIDELDSEKASTGSVSSVQTNLDNHTSDTSDAHDASAISILDTAGQYSATNAEDALAEVLDALQAHEADATAAHAATAISYAGSTNLVATTVEAGLDELDTEKLAVGTGTQDSTTFRRGDGTWAVPAGGTGLSLTEVEKNLGTTPKRAGKFNITSSGLTTGKHVLITQANGPYTGKGTLTDEAEMDAITATGKVTSATNIECYWRSPTKVKGNVKFAYAVG